MSSHIEMNPSGRPGRCSQCRNEQLLLSEILAEFPEIVPRVQQTGKNKAE